MPGTLMTIRTAGQREPQLVALTTEPRFRGAGRGHDVRDPESSIVRRSTGRSKEYSAFLQKSPAPALLPAPSLRAARNHGRAHSRGLWSSSLLARMSGQMGAEAGSVSSQEFPGPTADARGTRDGVRHDRRSEPVPRPWQGLTQAQVSARDSW